MFYEKYEDLVRESMEEINEENIDNWCLFYEEEKKYFQEKLESVSEVLKMEPIKGFDCLMGLDCDNSFKVVARDEINKFQEKLKLHSCETDEIYYGKRIFCEKCFVPNDFIQNTKYQIKENHSCESKNDFCDKCVSFNEFKKFKDCESIKLSKLVNI